MEYTERNGKYYIQGVLLVTKTPDGWTIFKRNNKIFNTYSPIHNEHYDNVSLALEKADEIIKQMELMDKRQVMAR